MTTTESGPAPCHRPTRGAEGPRAARSGDEPAHDRARRQHRERRPARHRPGPARPGRRGPVVGRHRLHADLRRLPAPRRQARRPPRPSPRIFIAGASLFAAASLLGGLAGSLGMLIGARLVQGLGGALMAPAALSMLTVVFAEGRERNRALGVWAAISAGGAAIGLIVGGVLTEYASWRWVLFVNVPVAVLAVVGRAAGAAREPRLPRAGVRRPRRAAGHQRSDRAGLRAGQGQRLRLGLGAHAADARAGGRPAGRVRDGAAPGAATRWSTSGCSAPAPCWAPTSGRCSSGPACSRCSSS